MNRLLSALVLGVYLASCTPALLPPAGSAATDGLPGRAASAGKAAGGMPDAAREERLVTAWLQKINQENSRLDRALKEQIPEMYSSVKKTLWEPDVRTFFPAPGTKPEDVWKKTPHTYAYQVSRDDIEITSGSRAGSTVYDVRQAGFLFYKVTEEELAFTEYIGKAELLTPFFRQCFGETAMQRAAGNFSPDLAAYPLVKAVLDKGVKPADYADYQAYYDLFLVERVGPEPPPPGDIDMYYYFAYAERLTKYRDEINVEHRAYLKQLDLYRIDTVTLLKEGETAPSFEHMLEGGINFDSPEFEARLNSFSLRKSAFENVGDILDGYWEVLKGVPSFRRMFEWAVENIGTYLSMAEVDTRVNLPSTFVCRHRVPVYRCYAPYLAVCGAAQAVALGWLELPVADVCLAGDKSHIDLPRITSIDDNKLGIRYASFETGRGNGQDGFSGYDSGGIKRGQHPLNGSSGEWRPDKFSMGECEIHANTTPQRQAAELAFAEAYYQYNYPYKVVSKAALKELSLTEVVEAVHRETYASIPVYWRDRFHGKDDERNFFWEWLDTVLIVLTIIDLIQLGYVTFAALSARLVMKAILRHVERYAVERAAQNEIRRAAFQARLAQSNLRHFGAAFESNYMLAELDFRYSVRTFWKRAYVKYIGPAGNVPPNLIGKATPDGMTYMLLNDHNVYLVPDYLKLHVSNMTPNLQMGFVRYRIFDHMPPVPNKPIFQEYQLTILENPYVFNPNWATNWERPMFYFTNDYSLSYPVWQGVPSRWYLFKTPLYRSRNPWNPWIGVPDIPPPYFPPA